MLRCGSREKVLMVLVDTGARHRIGVDGLIWLEIEKRG